MTLRHNDQPLTIGSVGAWAVRISAVGSQDQKRRSTKMPSWKTTLVVFTLLIVCLGAMLAQNPPARNVSEHRHPNLAAAQRLCAQAYQRILDAQRDNEWDMQGHAQRAKDLLDQANNELKQAAEAANRNHK
jgi:hypothetical protein